MVGTFGVAGGGGSWLAAQQQDQGVVGAEANLRAADRAFFQQVSLSLADGTPADKLADLEVREARIANGPTPQASFFDVPSEVGDAGANGAERNEMG